MNRQRSLQRTIGLALVLLVMLACSTLKLGQTPAPTVPSGPQPGHWEGTQVSFDVTVDGNITNLVLSAPFANSTCTLRIENIALTGNQFKIDAPGLYVITGNFDGTTATGTHKIEFCETTISFYPEEIKWSAQWKSQSSIPAFTPIPTETPTVNLTPTPITKTFSVTVPANEVWFYTNVNLTAGQTLIISASGKVNTNGGQASSETLSPDGQSNIPPCYTIDSDCLMPGVFWGTLVGRIGNGAPFKIGSQLEMPISSSGPLYLAVNDNTGYFEDNSGAFNVIITVR